MNVSIDKLLQPHPSYSRTGKMAEAFTPAKIHVASSERKGLDFSKLLSANEIGMDDQSPTCLCSSPRQHPSVILKEEYVTTQEKEATFKASMKGLLMDSSTQQVEMSPAGSLHSGVNWDDTKQKLKELRRECKKKQLPSSSFASVSRRALKKSDTPPVGHYRPRFDIVEESPPRVRICKSLGSPRKKEQSHKGNSTQSTTASTVVTAVGDISAIGHSGVQDDHVAAQNHQSAQHPTTAQKPPAAAPQPQQRAETPSWPFASKSPGHFLQLNRSFSVEPDPHRRINVSIVEVLKSNTYCSMSKMKGRDSTTNQIAAKDVFYNPKLNPFSKPPTPNFRVTTGRRPEGEPIPRTSADVERVASTVFCDPPNAESVKYVKQPVLVDYRRSASRTTSRKMPEPERDEPMLPPEALEMRRHSPTPEFSKYTSKKVTSPCVDLEYEVDYAAVDRHERTARVYEPSGLAGRGTASNAEAPKLVLNPNPALTRHRLGWAVPFEGYVSRTRRSRCGRVPDDPERFEAHNVSYDSALKPHISGDPKMALHMSRDRRMEIMTPPPCTTDAVYDVKPDAKFASPLRKGMIEIEKMVDRDKASPPRVR